MRKPEFEYKLIEEFNSHAETIKNRIINETEDRLKVRSKTESHLRSDDSLFEPYVYIHRVPNVLL